VDVPCLFQAALLKRLSLRQGWARFGALLVDAIEAMIRGMARESKERGGFAEAPAGFEEYLTYASGSVGLAVGLAAALVVIDEPSLEKRMSSIRDVHRIASRIVRVANDLRSHKRERGERKSNILAVAARQLGIPAEHADAERSTLMDAIEALAKRDLQDLRGAIRLVGGASRVPEQMVMRAVSGLLGVYQVADLHELSVLQRQTFES
jgi:terpene synthase-like protein